MLMTQTIAKLNCLRLHAMARALEQQFNNPTLQEMSFDERFSMLVDHESQARETRRVQRLLKNAKLKASDATLEGIDFRASRGLDKAKMTSLMSCDWIRKGQNLILTGPTGAGKTWLGCAFANEAVRLGMPVLYYRLTYLLEELEIAREDNTLVEMRARLAKAKLLVLDDWGLAPLTAQGRQDLFELIDDRSKLSTVITAQLPVSEWHGYIGDPTIADAILDRLVHSAHTIALTGDSMRKLKAAADVERNAT